MTTSVKSPAFKASPKSATDISSSSRRASKEGRGSRLISPSTSPVTPFTSVYNWSPQSRGAFPHNTLDTSSGVEDAADALRLILPLHRAQDRMEEGDMAISPSHVQVPMHHRPPETAPAEKRRHGHLRSMKNKGSYAPPCSPHQEYARLAAT
ncbi:hypothetical protein PF010_g2376 [Phytophthora fragariae]|uniref:Uncharacterized protein n=1 Tax=Phytophthora fragariae TaxID=53985 RepID=A0A6G0LXU8_9STRA|nr:hypothetical protein PF010_g2376 [Phytophthora fragariae]